MQNPEIKVPSMGYTKEKRQMRNRIETNRLILRPFEPSDAQAAFTWLGDPLVMQFTPSGPDKSIEETRTWLARYESMGSSTGWSMELSRETPGFRVSLFLLIQRRSRSWATN
jgi:RimJ/RimL family protein N-acetyltransferase